MKQVFISYSHQDAAIAERLAEALRKHHVASFVRPDAPVRTLGEDALDKAASEASGFVFLLGPASAFDEDQRREQRAALRSDWDTEKPMIPVLLPDGALLPFLRDRIPVKISSSATNYDEIAKQVMHYLKHPEANRDEEKYAEGKREWQRRIDSLKEWAHTLKQAVKDSERPEDSNRR
jgi:hypothetical protein